MPAPTIDLTLPEGPLARRLPDIEELARSLHFSPGTGEILLEDRRMVLMNSQALAALRRELIETVGVEKARGILTRMGYISGMRDAEMVRQLKAEGSVRDAFSIGPQLHSLEGFVAAESVTIDVDVESGHFYGEFIWRNSVEAETHIAAYGLGKAPVCWMQQGHANGYVSSFLGRQMLVREVECRAMGHPHCKIVGKSLNQWEDPEQDFRYLQAQAFVQVPGERIARPDMPVQALFGEAGGKIPLVGVSAGFNAVCHMLQRVAPTRATVLFLGESGVGKEQFARTLHNISGRAEQPFVAINCAAIPESLIESELFGVEKGGFSGASQSRPGRFERAHGGTLFLDEIGTLSFAAQGKLLRALQEGEIERIGDTRVRQVDVRVVAATNENLRALVEAGKFREDLFYRLNVFPVNIPPLRERREDILLLVEHFVTHYSSVHGRKVAGFTEAAIDALLNYAWPGNIRELENIIERGIILAPDNGGIDVMHLFTSGEVISPASPAPTAEAATRHSLPELLREQLAGGQWSLDALEDLVVRQAVELAGGNVSAAAKLLGTTRTRIAYRVSGRKVPHPAGRRD